MPSNKLRTFAGRFFAVLAAVLLIGVVSVYSISQYKLNRRHQITVPPLTIPTDAAAIAHGHHLALTRGCTDCHGMDFGGKSVMDSSLIGHISGPNITRGTGGLPKTFGDIDYVRAIRHGVDPNGRALVLMPSLEYSKLSDQDLGDLIAFLKTLKPVDRPRGPVHFGPLGRVLLTLGKIKLAADEIDQSAKPPVSVKAAVTPAYGHYLAASCVGCHGANLAGGKIPGGPPDWPESANLTPDPSSPIAKWTEKDFINTIKTHRRPDGSELSPVMPAGFGNMTDDELKAIWLYLRSVPPVHKPAKS